MKNAINLREMQEEARKSPTQPCMVCKKQLRAPYARWNSGWVCSRECNTRHMEKLKHDTV